MTQNLTPALALALWREALREEVGIRVPCRQTDLDKIKPIMYAARKAVIATEPALAELMLCVAPGGEEVWIVKRPKEAP